MEANNINQDKNIIPESILENLRPFKKHVNSTCMGCGYTGLMGVHKDSVPWYVSWWMIAVICFVIAPFIPKYAMFIGVGLAVARVALTKKIVSCPNCKETLVTK
ncbi:TPA: hypothetical protein ACIUWU_001649 [Shigella sonnei]|nr:hypothetical protein [Shigella sonnei]